MFGPRFFYVRMETLLGHKKIKLIVCKRNGRKTILKMKKILYLFIMALFVLGLSFSSCGRDEENDENDNGWSDNNGWNNDNNNNGGETVPTAPTGVAATVQSSSSINISWNTVSGATNYNVYYAIGSSATKNLAGTVSTTSYTHTGLQASTSYYYYIKATNSKGESDYSFYTSATTSSGSNNGGGGTTTKPSSPTNVSATNIGSALLPTIQISWSSVSNATSYKVYRSNSTSGSYFQIGSATSSTSLGDYSPLTGYNYYKVKAVNSAGESDYSSYTSYNHDPSSSVAPCPVTYGSCTVSGTTITMRWTVPKTTGCGTPTKAYLRVKNPISGVYADIETLSATATSTSFNYGPWTDSQGQVWVGIITENAKGTSGGVAKVYDTKSKKWIN